MDFSDALIHLKAGIRIARKYWDGAKELYVMEREDGLGNTICFTSYRGSTGVWIPANIDLLANDWFVIKVTESA